jgi:RNA polymerase sigma factor (sigma-70 family)
LFVMMPSDPSPALREFIARRSESSFRELVREHSPQVFATALRKLGGNRAAAQDVTQEVFTLLARKADKLGTVVLAGWLYRQTCRRAANHVRTETRRKTREIAAMPASEATTPADALDSRLLARELDDAMLALPTADRDALVLRYFEGKEYRSIGQCLGLSEEATRKRIQRALERLGNSLKRRGIAAGSVCLGTALESFGAPPVAAEMVSQFTSTALKTTVAPTALAALLKSALAGVLATSLVSGTALALRQPTTSSIPGAATRISPRDARSAGPSENLPENLTLEQIIAEIRRIRSSPETVLTELRLKVALAKIEVSQIPEFILRSKDILNLAERREIYQTLLEKWWNGSPDAALTFMLEEKIGPLIRGVGDNYLLGELFRRWVERDRIASETWLIRNWVDETLAKGHGEGSYRNFLSMWISGEYFSKGDIDGVFAFASRMPTVEDQARSICQLVGLAPMHTMWSYSNGSKGPLVEILSKT